MISVWLIEDNAAYRNSVARAINRLEGFACHKQFSSFEQAAREFGNAEPPDVLLLDVGLPGMDGIQALDRIHVLAPAAKVLILTFFDDSEKIFSAICAGASGYLLKTASIQEIADAIRQASEGGAPMHPKVARLVLERFSRLEAQRKTSPGYSLTIREKDVLELLVDGLTKKEIATRAGVSVNTVTTHLRRVYEKLQVNTNTGAVAKALRERLI